MNILIDMNLSPTWVEHLREAGFDAKHWSTIGEASASDSEILEWARDNQYVVFTHDLDFGSILSATRANSPSVIQIRTEDVSPSGLKDVIYGLLRRFREELAAGSLIVVDEKKARIRILPISR